MKQEEIKEIKPIVSGMGLKNLFITENGEIYKRVQTEQRDGVEVLNEGMYIYNVQDLADLTFGNYEKKQ